MYDESDPPSWPSAQTPGPTPDHPTDPAEPVPPAGSSSTTEEPAEAAATEPEPVTEVDPVITRFKACRFHAEDDGKEYCSNRDVLPYAGKGGFTPEAWCPDCKLYKLRRTPKKRPRPEDDDYPY